jgi:Ca-activated chloride channel family protein
MEGNPMVRSSSPRLAGCVGVLVVAAAAVGAAQEFRSGVAMVALSVTVLDGRGHSVEGLTAGDFAVFEDGVPQTVSLFGSEEVPLDVALILDSSASMVDLMPVVKAGARSLLSRLRDGDRATLIDLKRTISVRQDLTSDLPQVEAAVDAVEPGGTTALYDGVYLALRLFEHARRRHPDLRRQALVVFSDGIDTASRLDFTAVAELARAAHVAIYTITPDDRRIAWVGARLERRQIAMWELRTLTRDTGGVSFFPWQPDELTRAYDTIAEELVSQYSVGYVVPRPEDTRGFRRVLVRLLPPARGVARTRAGYEAGAEHMVTASSR